jgi:RNA polymerase sigma-70 factor, ECF subfamily
MASSSAPARVPKQTFHCLLAATQQGSGGALAALLDLYRPYLLATAAARIDHRLNAKAGASDLVQETLQEAHRKFAGLDEKPQTESQLRFWLRNTLLERLKALRRRYYRAQRRSVRRERSLDDYGSKEFLIKLAASNSETPAARMDRKINQTRLESALGRLAPAYQQIIRWRNRDGLRFTEIGRRIDRSADAARMLWYRALRQLKKELGIGDGD